MLDVAVEIRSVLNVGSANRGVGDDGSVVLERVANVAVLVGVLTDGVVVELIRVGYIVIPLVAIIFPGNIVGEHGVSDARSRGRWNREHSVVGVCIGESI